MESPLVMRLQAQMNALAFVLGDDETALRRSPPGGGWCALDHLAHLGRYHVVFRERLERILDEDTPDLGRYRAEDDAGFGRWRAYGRSELQRRMREERAGLIERIAALSPAQFGRRGRHPLFGALSLREWLEFFLLHEAHHLYRISLLARGG